MTASLGRILATAAVLAFGASAANAATVTFSNVTGTWFDAQLVAPFTPLETYTGNGTANASVRWGVDTGFGRSGYDFQAIPLAPVVVPPGASSGTFAIGNFNHVNFPILAPSISSIRLKFNADVDVDGVTFLNKTFSYVFAHDETTNSLDPCPYGGANGQGANINGCADHVQTNFNGTSDTFDIGGVEYTLDIEGFLVNGLPVTEFLTVEREVNNAQILGRITSLQNAVPEPATWAMMIAGFGMVGAAVRRRRMVTVTA